MDLISQILIFFSGISFLAYGFSLFTSLRMKEEFLRFKLENFRPLVGILEILGGAGLILGLFSYSILIISSGGLTLLMLLGVWVRLRIKDKVILLLPSLLFMILNLYIFMESI